MSLPPSFGNQTKKNPPPHPAYAAVPYNSYSSLPIQETSPSPDPNQQVSVSSIIWSCIIEELKDLPVKSPNMQGAAALSPDGPQSSFSQGEEENSYDLGNKCLPVQETDPAPQALNVPQVHHPYNQYSFELLKDFYI